VFQKIDFDGSGKIDMGELQRMFLENDIELSMDEIR
jgi:Ca2+-binding EF-hand superfamily protein